MLTGFDLCRAALAVSDITAPEQSVLTVLAIMANDDAQCWPAINGPAGLTGKTKLSERTVQNAVKALAAAGHITRLERAGRGVVYTVHPRTERAPACDAPPQEVRPAGGAPTPAPRAPKQPRTTKHKHGEGRERESTHVVTGQRGRRIDIDWRPEKPLPDEIRKAVDGWPPGQLDEELSEFRDFWLADAGQRATKMDWDRTWWNRLRTVIKNDRRRNERVRNGHRTANDRSEPQNPLVRAVIRAEAREAGRDGTGLQPHMLAG